MKKTIIIPLLFSVCVAVSQEKSESQSGIFTFVYVMPGDETVYLPARNSKETDTAKIILAGKLKFRITNKSGDTIFIRFNRYTDYRDQDLDPNYDISVNKTNIGRKFYFIAKPGELLKYKYIGISWGALIAPEKIRPKTTFQSEKIPLRLTTNISIGPYIGFQWGAKYFTDQGISSINNTIAAFASPYTSFAEINSSNSKDTANKNGTTAAAFSFGFGYLFNVSNKFQIGALIGWDYVSGDLADKWYYQGKPWYSIAIGFSFTK